MTLRDVAIAALAAGAPPGYSQFEESAMLDIIFDRLAIVPMATLEFGASTGPELSNTWAYAEAGARSTFVEADDERFAALAEAAKDLPRAEALHATVVSVDPWLPSQCDLVSIDVDDDDYWLLAEMDAKPAVVVIEFNPMVPPPVPFVGPAGFGASIASLAWLAESKGYSVVGATHCNLLVVRDDLAGPLVDEFDTDLCSIFDFTAVTFAVSNFNTGDYIMVGGWPFGRGEETSWT